MEYIEANQRFTSRGVGIAGLIAAFMGSYWLIMWFTGLAAPMTARTIIPKTNMALCQLLGGGALLLLGQIAPAAMRRRLGLSFALVVFLVSAVTVSEHAFQYDLGIDQLLASEAPGAIGTASPNRIGIPGSVSLLLLSIGLVALALGRRTIVPYLGLSVVLINLVPAIGYLYGADQLFNLPRVTGIAWHSTVALMAIGIGTILTVWEQGPLEMLMRKDAGGVLLRKMLPPAILIPLLVGYLRLLGQNTGLYDLAMGTALLVLGLILFFLLFLWRSASHLSRTAAAEAEANRALRQSEENLRQLNEELEERVKQRTAALERVNKELEAFSYSVSHDLKAPLRLITGFVDLLSRQAEGSLSGKHREYLSTIQSQASHMDDLIKALLEFSRLTRKELRLVKVDTRQLVEELVAEQRQILGKEAGACVSVELADLPIVEADPILLRMVFTNLLSNAFKFTRTVSAPRIAVEAKRKDGFVHFCIADNGVGFPKGQTEKLFKVFQRLHGHGEFEGTGIGLANVRKIVERHGGQICGEGEEGKGATFYFTLPRAE